MSDLRTAATLALEAMTAPRDAQWQSKHTAAVKALGAALAQEQEQAERVDEYRKGFIAGQIEMRDRDGEQAEPVKKREDFDHGVGADRFKVVRGAYWWHVLIGDSTTKHGKFHTQTGAEEMAALLLREFRNGAFVQHEAAQEQADFPGCDHCRHPLYAATKCRVCGRVTERAEPAATVAETATTQQQIADTPPSDYRRGYWDGFAVGKREGRIEAEDAAKQAEPVQGPVAFKDAPERVWLQACEDDHCEVSFREHAEITWCAEQQNPLDVPYVRADLVAPPQRKPLTTQQILDLFDSHNVYGSKWVEFARAIERAHGIGGQE